MKVNPHSKITLAKQSFSQIWKEPEHQQRPVLTDTAEQQELLQKLLALNKNQHTLDLAADIFADVRVRQLGYQRFSLS